MPISDSLPPLGGFTPPSPASLPVPVPLPTPAKKAPGASFLNTLLAADLDKNGLSKGEIAAAIQKLKLLAQDKKENDGAETSLLSALTAANKSKHAIPVEYEVTDQGLTLHLAQPSSADAVFVFAGTKPGTLEKGVMTKGEVKVELGTDPGDFYCEHMFFSAQIAAALPGATVCTNKAGEKLVGFLHLPSDAHTSGELAVESQDARHEKTRQVVGAALRGYYEAARAASGSGPVRLLLTGYDTFGWVKNNPTGDFVTHPENLDAAMKLAFGPALLSVAEGETHGALSERRYTVQQGKHPREIVLSAIRFPVADPAINPQDPGSIFGIMKAVGPHAVLSMGVAGDGPYRAEFRADSGGLDRKEGAAHVDGEGDRVRLRNNYALGRAIEAGAKLLTA